ncbi:MAG: cytochrome-c peroxidase [Bacteroidia bacterium]|nr:cytochrome-c peroxidase [Bacteroidia bacterium]
MKYILTILLSAGCLAMQPLVIGLLEYPAYFPEPVYDFSRNELRSETIELGRALFYDPILSQDLTISCASCHSPYNAFAHTDHDLSHGIHDQIGTRNAPALFNLAWQSTFMWDGAINHLDMQALAPISHPGEMGENIQHIVQKLQESERYPPLFYEAFGDSAITGAAVLKALAQFQLTLVSANARYDEMRRGEVSFTEQEANGYALFLTHCNTCHAEPLFTTGGFANNGLPIDSTLNDFGKGAMTHEAQDSLLFKIPTLRNLSFTYPYMHDGRFRNLNQVLTHYLKGITPSSTLAPALSAGIALSSNERTDLIAFLLTLNDKAFVFDPSHQFK